MGALTGDPLSQFIDEQRVEMCEVVGLVTAKCPPADEDKILHCYGAQKSTRGPWRSSGGTGSQTRGKVLAAGLES